MIRYLTMLVLAAATFGGDGRSDPEVACDLSWLEGTWEADAWGGKLTATYAEGRDGGVIGHSSLRHGADESYYEFEVFVVEDGEASVTPYPGGKKAERFALASAGAERAVFEHPEKDYPTRITYERRGEGLVITLEDPHGTSGKTETFEFVRKK